jgi:agmatinase
MGRCGKKQITVRYQGEILRKQRLLKTNQRLQTIDRPYDMASTGNTIYSNALHLLGFEFDGTACFRKGTAQGPNAFRRVSDGIETYSPYLDADTEDLPSFYDLGNLMVNDEKGEQNWQMATDHFDEIFGDIDFKKENVRTIVLGGEHSISYAPIKHYLECYPNLILLHLDAHADLRDGYLGYHYSHASIIRRVLEHFRMGHSLIQYGIRSGTKEEYQWMRDNNTLMTSRKQLLECLQNIPEDRPIYLSLDLDYFDPSFFPGTGTPEPGGEDFHSFISIVKILRQKNFVGCDVVELAPGIDPTDNSSVFATKVVRELILLLGDK